MDVWQAIDTRRAVRVFDGHPIDPAHLEGILRAGRRSGSSKNQQRWDFIVIESPDTLHGLAKVGPYAGHLAGAAAAIALVTPDPTAPGAPMSVLYDIGQATAYMQLAAWELGIGSVPATVYDHGLARRILGYPPGTYCEYILSFGYPADPTDLTRPNRPGGRRPLEEMVHRERW